MVHRILHVWRNTPFGRETLRETLHFAEHVGAELELIHPQVAKSLLDMGTGLISLGLDSSYLRAPDSARENAEAMLARSKVQATWLEPQAEAAEGLPVYAIKSDYVTCPRVMSQRSTRIGLGQIGSGVRHIVNKAPSPILIPAPVFRPWTRVVVFFGGSKMSLQATRLAGAVSHAAGVPLVVFSHLESTAKQKRETLEESFESIRHELPEHEWRVETGQPQQEAMMAVPTDALLVLGAYGHGLIHKRLFGGFAETVQTVIPAPLLIVGPHLPEVST